MKKRLYHLQQRLGITRPEAAALSVLLGLFLLGAGVRAWQSHVIEQPVFEYHEVDSLFAVSTEKLRADLLEGAPALQNPRGPVDVNRAGSTELQQLPRIGPALAGRILEYRSRHGGFREVDELTNVAGIGVKTLEALRPLVTLTPPDSLVRSADPDPAR